MTFINKNLQYLLQAQDEQCLDYKNAYEKSMLYKKQYSDYLYHILIDNHYDVSFEIYEEKTYFIQKLNGLYNQELKQLMDDFEIIKNISKKLDSKLILKIPKDFLPQEQIISCISKSSITAFVEKNILNIINNIWGKLKGDEILKIIQKEDEQKTILFRRVHEIVSQKIDLLHDLMKVFTISNNKNTFQLNLEDYTKHDYVLKMKIDMLMYDIFILCFNNIKHD